MKRGGLIAIAVVALLLISVGGCLVGNYNRLVTGDQAVKQKWAQVNNQLQRRNDLIGNLAETVKGTATQEQAVVVMERLRTAIARADWSDLPLSSPVTVSIGVATAPEVDGKSSGAVGWRVFDRLCRRITSMWQSLPRACDGGASKLGACRPATPLAPRRP